MKSKFHDLIFFHAVFDRLTVISEPVLLDNRKYYVLCKCICGTVKLHDVYGLVHNTTKSCGCLQRESPRNLTNNLLGKKWGRLTVIENLGYSKAKCWWLCECECGSKIKLCTADINRENQISCGCFSLEVNRQRFSGSNNPKFNPNLSDEDRTHRDYDNQETEWSFKIKEKFNFTCQKCGKFGCHLNSHHIENYSQHPEKRYCLDNGIYLCLSCHRSFHKQYGNQNNNLIQLNEFLNAN